MTALSLTDLKPAFLGGVDALKDAVQVTHARDPLEALGVQGVQADIEAVEAGVFEGLGVAVEQKAVGGHGDALDAVDRAQLGDQVGDVGAHQGLAAGDAHAGDALCSEDLDQLGDLVVAQVFFAGDLPDPLGWHAVDAAEIATLRDGDAQVGHLAPVAVLKVGESRLCHYNGGVGG